MDDVTQAYIQAWHGIAPPNAAGRRLAADLSHVIQAFEAQRGRLQFEDEPAGFEAALRDTAEMDAPTVAAAPAPLAAHTVPLNHLSLTEAAAAVASGATTATALLEACLAAIDAHEPVVNATIWIDRDGARAAAAQADQAVTRGDPLGPLHGVPLAHKDMYYQAGKVSTCGSAIRRNFVADRTATVLDRLHRAGSITFAGLNMAEFAQNPTGHNRHHGDCHNPWHPPFITGGSSSGSGAAVAARFTFAALGSDTGGSIRLPAAACGTVGLKPTQTRISRAGVMPLSFSADNVGPLTRTVRDCARLMTVIAGRDPLDPTSADRPVPDYEAALTGDIRGLRVGLVTNPGLMGKDAPVVAAIQAAADILAARGAIVTPVTLPLMDAVSAYVAIISRCEGAAIHARWMRERPDDYAIHLSGRLYPGYAIPAAYYIEALSARGPILRQFVADAFAAVDLLLLPTIATILPTLADTDIDHGPPEALDRFMAVSANTRPFNYLGLPAISVNAGFDPHLCPIGLQLVGRPFAETTVMRAADAYQRDTGWHLRVPACDMAAP